MAARKKKREPEPTFEQALGRLEEIVEKLEGGDLALETALGLFQEGVELGRRCSARLDEAEQTIRLLLEKADGSTSEVPLDESPAAEPEPGKAAPPAVPDDDDLPF